MTKLCPDEQAEHDALLQASAQLSAALGYVRQRLAVYNERILGPRPDYRIAIRPHDGYDPTDDAALLDDIVVKQVPMFRAEQMDERTFWVACYLDEDAGDRICWNVQARSKPLRLEWTMSEWPDSEHVFEHEVAAKS